MANNKNSGTRSRFTLPSADDLDKSTGKILNGATFQSKRRAIELRGTEKEKNNFKSRDPEMSHSKQSSIAQRKHEKSEHSISNAAPNILFNKGNIDEPPKVNGISEVDEVGKGSVQNSLANKMQNEIPDAPAIQFKTDAAVSVTKVGTNSIIVNARQRGNPVLKHIRNVPWEFGEVLPDYVLGQTTCALFLSLRYHNFNPEYIHDRLKQLGNRFQLRILLVQVDVKDPHASLKELSKICILADCTLILAWSIEEAGRYLETYKSYENKPADILQEKVDGDYHSKMVDCLTSVKSVNKTDAVTLMSNFGSLKNMVNASRDEISLCPGFGPQKAQKLAKICHEPFVKQNTRVSENLTAPSPTKEVSLTKDVSSKT